MFEYKTVDENGNTTTKYYNIKLKTSGDGALGTSEYITWQEIDEAGDDNIVRVKFSNNVTKYYKFTIAEGHNTSGFLSNPTENITADFVLNVGNGGNGGAIYNSSTGDIDKITGDFIGNYLSVQSAPILYGGAIFNAGNINNISGDFIDNYIFSTSRITNGGAICNYSSSSSIGTIGNITGNFIGNYTYSSLSDYAYGGAIYNMGIISNITGDFISNYASSANSSGLGGAIYNNKGIIGNITGDFISNYALGLGSTSTRGGAIYNANGSIGNITGDFISNYASGISSYSGANYSYGGAIYNTNSSIGNITGDFISNYASSANSSVSGGAIYNDNGIIGNITGNFIGNYASGLNSYGGAIYNLAIIGEKSSSGKVIGGIINSNFYDNHAYAQSGVAQGGAIWTNKDLNIIADNGTSTFKGNYILVAGGQRDYQAIWVEDFNAGFFSTTASLLDLPYSGTIYETTSTNPILTFEAKNNGQITLYDKVSFQSTPSADPEPLYRWNHVNESLNISGKSRAVSTYRNLDENYNTLDVYKYWSEYKSIKLPTNLTKRVYTYHILDADNNETAVAKYWNLNNTYHILDENNNEIAAYKCLSSSEKNGIYIHSIENIATGEVKTIKSYSKDFIIALNTPEVYSYAMSTPQNYNAYFTGDSTGVINLFNDIENAIVKVDTVTVNLADDEMRNYEFYKLISDDSAKYVMDIDFAGEGNSDKITTTTDSSGTITINSLNVKNMSLLNLNEGCKIQILNTQTDALQLALSDAVKNQRFHLFRIIKEYPIDSINATTKWNDEYKAHEQQIDYYAKAELTTIQTTNDSIHIYATPPEEGELKPKPNPGDTLALWNNYYTTEIKNFNFDSAKNIYTFGKDYNSDENPILMTLGEAKGSELNINGVLDGENRSTIDLNGFEGFEVKTALTYNINNVEIKNGNGGVIEVTNNDAVINILNTNFKDNISETSGSAIYSTGSVNITANNATSEFTGNLSNETNNAIFIANGEKALTLNAINDGIITLNDSIGGENGYTVKIKGDETGTINLYNDVNNANVVADTVKINLANGEFHDYKFESLESDGSANYAIDIDFANNESDKITTNSASSGTITINSLNFLSELPNSLEENYKLQILNTQSDSLQLVLTDAVKEKLNKEYNYGSTCEITTDDITAVTQWDFEYNDHYNYYDYIGTLDVTTTNTTNDSIGIVVTKKHNHTDDSIIGDTLELWNRFETEENKEFNFDSEDDKYLVASKYAVEKLGETKGTELAINGVIGKDTDNRSTIDMHIRKGFEINGAQTFNVKDVNIVNAVGGVLEVNDPNAKINLVNTSFYNNTSSTRGAAIYSMADVNMTADGAVTRLYNNTVSTDGSDISESIYIANKDKALNLDIIKGGTFSLEDSINGEKGYDVNITGDGTGTFNLFGDINNANVNIENVTVNLTDGINREYTFESLKSSEDARYLIGIDLADLSSDKFITLKESSGVITIAGLQIANEVPENIDESYTIRILHT